MSDKIWWIIQANSDDMKYPEDVITVLALQILTLKIIARKTILKMQAKL